ERIVFGSDWPMADPAAEIAAIDALGLTDGETKSVLGGTLARVLGIASPGACDCACGACRTPPAPTRTAIRRASQTVPRWVQVIGAASTSGNLRSAYLTYSSMWWAMASAEACGSRVAIAW